MCEPKNRIWYHPDLIECAREFRNNPTKAEFLLWKKLKGRQVKGYDFHRQKPLLYYVVDFYCPKLKLAIEVDGSIHTREENMIRDNIRTDELKTYGITVLRFTNIQVFRDTRKVVWEIEEWIEGYV